MRVTIDIAGTPTDWAPVEISVPERATASPTIVGEVAGGMLGDMQQYDGGADRGTLPAEPVAEFGAQAPAPLAPGAAYNGGAAPGTAETASAQRIPTQVQASAELNGGSAAG
jgi:hypothetical protein